MARQAVSVEEVKNIIEAALITDTGDPHPDGERRALYVALLWYTGGRASEVLKIKRENIGQNYIVMVNLKRHTTYMHNGVQRSIKNPRSPWKQVFIPTEVAQQIRVFCEEHAIRPEQYIFAHSGEVPWSRTYAWRLITESAHRAGILKVKNSTGQIVPAWPHTFRHGNAEHLYDRTRDILFVKEQLGHSALSSTMIYTTVSPARRAQYAETAFKE